ncbi:MAG TPA: DUF58 domain-containing protein [Vicinamibacteria bacterium]|nr:DUF58 domain-containing protein [Vicinamibacteria bacterium]
MIPRQRLILVVSLVGAVFVVSVWVEWLATVGLAANGLVTLIALVDFVRTRRADLIEVDRDVSEVLSVGARNRVVLRLTNRSSTPLLVELTDEPPSPCRMEGLPTKADLPPRREVEVSYHLIPSRRGPNRFAFVHFRYQSPLGLWTRVVKRALPTEVRIYPDIRTVRRFDLLARRNRLAEMGLKVWRLRGREGEFERLREYRREDEMRQIDWRATAKHGKLISREYTTERNQNIVLLLDCGRTMLNETEGISHLDRALNAAIILSYIALGQGDNISLVAFSNRIERLVGPVRGKAAVQTLIRQTYDLAPRLEASDYALACEDLARRQKKRALVLLITYALDERHLETMGRYLRGLVSSHLFVLVLLKDIPLIEVAERIPRTDLEAYRAAAATEMLNAQERRIAALRTSGIHVTEVVPGELTAAAINQYLDVKSRQLL